MRRALRVGALALAPILFGVAQPTCSQGPICQALGNGTCYYADDLPGRGGRGTFTDPFRLGDFPASANDCDDRGALPARLRPGDVFYFRAGSYAFDLCANKDDGAYFKPMLDAQGDGTAAAPIVFRSYPGETATLIRRSGIAAIAGSYGDDHVRFIGLHWRYPRVSPDDDNLGASGRQAFVILGGDHVGLAYNTIEMFDHPRQQGAIDNHEAVFVSNADFTYIGHNRFLGPGNPGNPVPAQNCTSLKSYITRFMVVEDNWFDRAANPMFDKEDGVDNTYRRNLTTGSSYASFNANGNDVPWWGRARIHDNVFDRGIQVTFLADGYEVYRNDVKNAGLFQAHGAVNGREIYRLALYDNILRADGEVSGFTGHRSGQTWSDRNAIFRYLDHNCYVGRNTVSRYFFGRNGTWDIRGISDMRAAGFERNARATDRDGSCGSGRSGSGVGPEKPQLVTNIARYGIGNDSLAACSDGIDQDGDWAVDYPADRDCTSPDDTSEGAGTNDVAPRIVSIGGPYLSRGGAPLQFNVTVSDPDSSERVSWSVVEGGKCSRRVQGFRPSQLVEDPELRGLPAVDGQCRMRVSVYDDRGRVVSEEISITLRER